MNLRTFLLLFSSLFLVASPAFAATATEYIILLILADESGGTVVEGVQMPSALEQDCARDAATSVLCEEIRSLEGASTVEALASLNAWGWLLEATVDANPEALAAAAGCAQASVSEWGHDTFQYTIEDSGGSKVAQVQDLRVRSAAGNDSPRASTGAASKTGFSGVYPGHYTVTEVAPEDACQAAARQQAQKAAETRTIEPDNTAPGHQIVTLAYVDAVQASLTAGTDWSEARRESAIGTDGTRTGFLFTLQFD